MPVTNINRTITQASFDQGAAGSTDLVTAPGTGKKIYVVAVVVGLSAGGTVKFQENASTDLTGALPVGASTPYVLIGDGINPILQTNTANQKLNLVSATGAAKGYIRYFTE
jgi:hypothetical protein